MTEEELVEAVTMSFGDNCQTDQAIAAINLCRKHFAGIAENLANIWMKAEKNGATYLLCKGAITASLDIRDAILNDNSDVGEA